MRHLDKFAIRRQAMKIAELAVEAAADGNEFAVDWQAMNMSRDDRRAIEDELRDLARTMKHRVDSMHAQQEIRDAKKASVGF